MGRTGRAIVHQHLRRVLSTRSGTTCARLSGRRGLKSRFRRTSQPNTSSRRSCSYCTGGSRAEAHSRRARSMSVPLVGRSGGQPRERVKTRHESSRTLCSAARWLHAALGGTKRDEHREPDVDSRAAPRERLQRVGHNARRHAGTFRPSRLRNIVCTPACSFATVKISCDSIARSWPDLPENSKRPNQVSRSSSASFVSARKAFVASFPGSWSRPHATVLAQMLP